MKKSELMKQIEIATERSRELRQAAPYLFVEYQNMQDLKREYQSAKNKYENAKETWRRSLIKAGEEE